MQAASGLISTTNAAPATHRPASADVNGSSAPARAPWFA
jgi:hypothetical protein